MKLYITGPVGSGKTTLARQLSQKTGVPCFHLDQVAHEPDRTVPAATGNGRRKSGTQCSVPFWNRRTIS